MQAQTGLTDKHIAFIGAGSIAEALIKGLCQTGIASPRRIAVTNRRSRDRLAWLKETYGVRVYPDMRDTVWSADVIILCTKPNDVHQALATVARHASPDALYLSVAAGCTIASIADRIAAHHPEGQHRARPRVVRTMPNTSCAVLESATAYALGDTCTEADRRTVEAILGAVGSAYPVEEHLLNAVTGLSGSGPAYVYYLVEAMTSAGVDAGLDEQTAFSMVAQTLYGAARMLQSSGQSPAFLRERVTSPGGTTFAAISTLDQHGFSTAVLQAVRSATVRAEQLGMELAEQKR
ncbi:MAG: pyrroline-5-carboxylate reductase [Bacilli bacterium]